MYVEVLLLCLLLLDLTAGDGASTSMGLCSEDQFQCGSTCFDFYDEYSDEYYEDYDYSQLHDYNYYASRYWSCDRECQATSDQCHGECPDGWVSCGSQNCRPANSSTGETWECGDSCISKSSQCNTLCPPDYPYPCCGTCSATAVSRETWQCGEDCLPRTQSCLGECSEGFFSCGAECRRDDVHRHTWTCGRECIHVDTACNGSCKSETRRVCGDKCIDSSTSCNGACPEELILCGAACVAQDSSDTMCPCEPGTLPCGPAGVLDSPAKICITQFCQTWSYSEPFCRINTDDNQQRCAEACFKYDRATGALSTTQYPEPYLNNQDCGLDISAPEGYQIFIQFLDFETDYWDDFLYIYDALTVEKREDYSEVRRETDMTPYLSSNNNIKLVFKTDSSREMRGFNATVQFIKVKQCDSDGRCVLQCPPSFMPCNGYCSLDTLGCRQKCLVFNQTTMTLTRQISDYEQPNPQSPYTTENPWGNDYEECHITIHSQFQNESIHLSFHQFDMGPGPGGQGGAAFYDGENLFSPLLEKRTGNSKTKPILSSGSSLTINFVGYTEDNLQALNATVSFVQINPKSCPPGFSTCGGTCRAEESVCGLTCGPGPNPSPDPKDYTAGPTLFWECGDECLESGQQCDGACPPDHIPCGSTCLRDLAVSRQLFYSCGDQCLYKGYQCLGQCPENYLVCGAICRNPRIYRICGDECLTEDQQCDGECPDGKFACGKTDCRPTYMASHYTCGHQCLEKDTPCQGSCPAGFKFCGPTCKEDISLSVSVPSTASEPATSKPSPPGFSAQCCLMKQVGGEAYMTAGTNATITSRTTCKDACIYRRMRDGRLFCFAIGNLPVNCLHLESLFGLLFGSLFGTLQPNGTLTIPFGGTLLTNGTLTNPLGRTLLTNGTLTIPFGGTLLTNGKLTNPFDGTLLTNGTLTIPFGKTLLTNGTLTNLFG